MTPDEVVQVLAIWEAADLYEELFWRIRDDGAHLFANCSDFFAWATADGEEITAADLPLLRRCLADLRPLDAEYWLPQLFAARKRQMRPQQPVYKDMDPAVAAMFDECCTPEKRAEFDREDAAFWLGVAQLAAGGKTRRPWWRRRKPRHAGKPDPS